MQAGGRCDHVRFSSEQSTGISVGRVVGLGQETNVLYFFDTYDGDKWTVDPEGLDFADEQEALRNAHAALQTWPMTRYPTAASTC